MYEKANWTENMHKLDSIKFVWTLQLCMSLALSLMKPLNPTPFVEITWLPLPSFHRLRPTFMPLINFFPSFSCTYSHTEHQTRLRSAAEGGGRGRKEVRNTLPTREPENAATLLASSLPTGVDTFQHICFSIKTTLTSKLNFLSPEIHMNCRFLKNSFINSLMDYNSYASFSVFPCLISFWCSYWNWIFLYIG